MSGERTGLQGAQSANGNKDSRREERTGSWGSRGQPWEWPTVLFLPGHLREVTDDLGRCCHASLWGMLKTAFLATVTLQTLKRHTRNNEDKECVICPEVSHLDIIASFFYFSSTWKAEGPRTRDRSYNCCLSPQQPGWIKTKSGDWNPIWASHRVAGAQLLGPPSAPSW